MYIEDIAYELEYENHVFYFSILPNASKKRVIELSPIELAFGDEVPEKVWHAVNANPGAVIKVMRAMKEFMAEVIAAHDPYYFSYSANEDAKLVAYEKIGAKIAREHGYDVYRDGNHFRFYKKIGLAA